MNHSFIKFITPIYLPGAEPPHSNRDSAKDPGHPNPKFAVGALTATPTPKEVYDPLKRFAELSLTHIIHLLEPDGKLITWTGIKGLDSSKGTQPPYARDEFDALCSGILTCWYRITDGTNTPNPSSIPEFIRTTSLTR